MKPIIEVNNLSKKFIISHEGIERYSSLRDIISKKIKNLVLGNSIKPLTEEFWALNNISFEINKGDRVGIIGRNGAGKSTLLKLISRIIEPTTGSIKMRGRVASLLEVGTGFHAELTGRENIFLNGAILGMSRQEIKNKFDQIVEFAEIEKFLDTPVKRYSSGMYVRLAFAVAAHLEPEILIVDEVLAVGDAEFQKKSLGKMDDVSNKDGRTVIFVSHNMSAIRHLCNKSIVLNKGEIIYFGDVDSAINIYKSLNNNSNAEYKTNKNTNKPFFSSIRIINPVINYGEELELEIEISSKTTEKYGIEMEVHDERGNKISYSSTAPMQNTLNEITADTIQKFKLTVQDIKFASGEYELFLWLTKPWVEDFDRLNAGLKFSINMSDPFMSGFDFKQSYNRGVTHHKLILEKL